MASDRLPSREQRIGVMTPRNVRCEESTFCEDLETASPPIYDRWQQDNHIFFAIRETDGEMELIGGRG